jgi:hypothetical protein
VDIRKVGHPRFAYPTVLSAQTVVLGVPVSIWHQTFTGNLDQSLDELKKKIRTDHRNSSSITDELAPRTPEIRSVKCRESPHREGDLSQIVRANA